MSDFPQKPVLDQFEIKLKCSGRVVVMQPLSMRMQRKLDACATSATDMAYFRISGMAMSIDGKALPPVSEKADLDANMDYFSGDEADELSEVLIARSKEVEKNLKNASTPSALSAAESPQV